MKNNIFKKLSIVLFIVSYLIITIFVIFAKDSNNDGQRASFTFQKFELKNINIFINDFEKYLLDNVKYRDEIINFDIYLKKYFGLNYGDENINIVDTKNKTNFNNDFFLDENIATISQIENVAEVYNKLNNINFNIADVKNAANKVVIMGEKENVRAVNIFNGSYHTIDDVALRMNTISAILNNSEELADKKKATMAQVSLAWILSKPLVASPIVGFTKISQLESICDVFKIKLTDEDIKYLEELYVPHKVVGALKKE